MHRHFSRIAAIIFFSSLVLHAAASAETHIGKVYGVFVGISEYKSMTALPYCADDALRLARTFMNMEGPLKLDPSRAIILQDSKSSLASVKAALHRMAGRLEPDDVFIFYFSGHGGGPDEPDLAPLDEDDHHDETLVVWDGDGSHKRDLSDDALREILDSFPNRRQFVFLDSCFSGGFVKDLARQGRLVMTASRENQSSSVAYAHRISGAFTHALMEGLRGDADKNADRNIDVAELKAYLAEAVPEYCSSCGRRNAGISGPMGLTAGAEDREALSTNPGVITKKRSSSSTRSAESGRARVNRSIRRCFYDDSRLGPSIAEPLFGGSIDMTVLCRVESAYRPPHCATPDERAACSASPQNCACQIKGECGEPACERMGRKATDGCASAVDKQACRRNPALCPCPDYGLCNMPKCVAPPGESCEDEDDRNQCESNPEKCPCKNFGDCDMASCRGR